MILAGGHIVDVVAKNTYQADVLIDGATITEIGSPRRRGHGIVDVSGRYVAPGLVDSHLHIESSWLSPIEFARNAVRHGTTTILVDPHEIANVCGRKGIDLFLDQSELLPLRMFIGIPSCVPATELEDGGARISIDDIRQLVKDPRVYGLAEMMNFPGIIHGDVEARRKVALVYDFGKIVDGHCPGLSGHDLHAYVTNGRHDGVVRIMSDHECTSAPECLEKHGAGMYIALRYGSASKDLDRILPALITSNIPLDKFMLCSDDLDPVELYEGGHVARIIKRARELILDNSDLTLTQATILALSLATINPAGYMSDFLRLHGHPGIGHIEVGRKADLVVLDSLDTLAVEKVIHSGKIVVDDGQYIGPAVEYDYTDFLGRVNVGAEISARDFAVRYEGDRTRANVKVIGAIGGSLQTELRETAFDVEAGELKVNPQEDIAKIAVIERHKSTGSYSVGFVKGLGVRRGAIASTFAHDSHNLIVAGADDDSMARAANHLRDKGGGMVVAIDDGIHYLPLRIAGVMSTESIDRVVAGYKSLVDAARHTGTSLQNIFTTLSFLSLPVIPDLKITNRGLVRPRGTR